MDARREWQRQLGRIHLAVMLEQEPIGEVILKDIDAEKRCCTLSIHMKNESVKNRGFGTRAEILTLEYAFGVLEMETAFAEAIHKNKRCRHVLEKVGFQKTHSDEQFVYTGVIKKYGMGIRRTAGSRYARRRHLDYTVYDSTNACQTQQNFYFVAFSGSEKKPAVLRR